MGVATLYGLSVVSTVPTETIKNLKILYVIEMLGGLVKGLMRRYIYVSISNRTV